MWNRLLRGQRPVDPVPRRLRARRQLLGGLPAPAPRHRGLAGAHRAVLQPHRLRRSGPAGSSTARPSRRSCRASPTAACSAAATPSCRATSARPTSGTPSSATVGRVRAANADAVYCCDPVIGDVGPRDLRAPGHRGVPARGRGAGRRHRHAQPLRARPAVRDDDRLARRGEGRRRRRPGARAPGGPDDVAGHRRHPGRRRRPAGVRGRPALPRAHARGWASR